MSHAPWTIRIKKAYLKFSAAHMTVYPNATKEPLHGHNYQVHLDLEVTDASFEAMVDFGTYKDILRNLCDEWDEMILVQGNNPHVKVGESQGQTKLEVYGKRYEFPTDEVHVLPIENITTELLAQELTLRLVGRLREHRLLEWSATGNGTASGKGPEVIQGIRLGVFETAGQGASFYLTRDSYLGT